jgi:hypothetical protein
MIEINIEYPAWQRKGALHGSALSDILSSRNTCTANSVTSRTQAHGNLISCSISHKPSGLLPCVCTLCSTKISGLKFSKYRTGSHVTYSCHHSSWVFYFPHICANVTFLFLPFITINHAAYILTKDTNTFA